MCKATCGAERYPKDRDIEVPRVRLAHHDESIEQDWWCVPTGNPCVRGSRTSLGVDEHETACVLTGNPACTKLVDVPTQCRVDPVGQYRVLVLAGQLARAKYERRSAALWSDEPPHGRAR
ncbi:hypothetical protein PC117_g9660 [Phytophthora cactorum]|uniref:Uncharacterized protein n=1 Tax=Phytophthora cactorum TaxID=29920 RepID=A0A8T1DQ79_9STRA|nr:hypothetical protein PC117_g9660 [Phytophthora cactorum]